MDVAREKKDKMKVAEPRLGRDFRIRVYQPQISPDSRL